MDNSFSGTFEARNTDSSVLGEIGFNEKNRIRDLYLASAYPVTSRAPRLLASAGNIAAGKTSLLRFLSATGKLPAAHAVRHDPDAVMSEISGYRNDTLHQPIAAFSRWELPARLLAEEILTEAVKRRCDIVYDRTCALPESLKLLRRIKSQEHYEITMYFVWTSVPECLERAIKRAHTSRRYIPESLILERAESLRKLVPLYVELAEEVLIYENHADSNPRHIGTLNGKNRSTVHDSAAFEKFLEEHNVVI